MERYVGYSGRGRPSPRLGVQRIPKKSLVGLYLSERAPRFGQDLCISYSLNLTLHRIMFAPETHSLRRDRDGRHGHVESKSRTGPDARWPSLRQPSGPGSSYGVAGPGRRLLRKSGRNFFIVNDGVLRTPTGRAILQGVSRLDVLQVAEQSWIPV